MRTHAELGAPSGVVCSLRRDVKGDNVLVRRADGRAILMDFGSGIYAGASSLTLQPIPPFTPAYCSPEAALVELRVLRERSFRYRATPADDLYALGVTACRLVTGKYPEPGEPLQDETGTWRLESVILPPELLGDAGVDPLLRGWILRLLSVRPEERGTARELAEGLERLSEPRRTEGAEACVGTRGGASSRRRRVHLDRRWLVMAAACVALAVGLWWLAPDSSREEPSGRAAVSIAEQPDAGTVGLGDSAAAESTEDESKLSTPEGVAQDTLPEPLPEQMRPDAKGRCPGKRLVALNGGCWLEASIESEECEGVRGQMFKGTCYVPSFSPKRRPTSSPVDKRSSEPGGRVPPP